MAVAQRPVLAPVLLLMSLGLSCCSALPDCPEPCTCQSASLLNCSSSGLSLPLQLIPDSVTELDLSHNLLDSVTLNRPHHNLQNVWLGSNRITRLSLCMERNLGARTRSSHRSRPWSRRGCVSWAPILQLLSAERNQLEQLPEGLNGSESLRVLRLSFNRISILRPGDLDHLPHLAELHLQHNLIASLHPQMFQELTKLRVLDLSFNRLTSLHPLMYGYLRNIGTDVRLHGNRWHCDCTTRTLRRRMTYDSSRGLQVWDVVCASPSILTGRDLLQLKEDELNCFSTENRAELHQDVTVYSGSKILLSCSSEDSLWWTPSGQASVTQSQAGLLITDITDKDVGLYVCTTEEDQVVSVYNLQISKTEGEIRRIRSLSRNSRQIIQQDTSNTMSRERNLQTTQSDFVLAVCLSVFITFLIAFVLGVLARPCIDGLWETVTNKRNSPEISPESTAEQRQYDNEAFSNGEEPEVIINRERRVTFSTVNFKEHTNVQYHDIVANGDQETLNNYAVIECETAVDSGSGNGSQPNIPEKELKESRDLSGVTDTDCPHNTEFEHIPDPVEQDRRRSLSSCSDSSLSDKVCDEDQKIQRDRTAPKSPQLVEDSVLQRTEVGTERKAEVSQISTESSVVPKYSSEPFTDWSPHATIDNLTDPELWQETEEQFEFSDSYQSISERSSSVCGFFNNSKLMVAPTLHKQMKDERSSSSSCVSEDEPTEYTLYSDKEEEEDIEQNKSKPEFTKVLLKQDSGFQKQSHGADPSLGFNVSSPSSDSDGEEDYRGEVKTLSPTKKNVSGLVTTSQGKGLDRITSPPAADSSSSSSDSEEEGKTLKVELSAGRVNERIEINERETLSTELDCQYIPQIKANSAVSNPSSSDDSMDETTKHSNRRERGDVFVKGLPVKEYPSVSLDANEPRWPALDLSHVSPIKRRLDIKSPSSPSDSSSSSESDDGTSKNISTQDQGQLHMAILTTKESQTVGRDPQTQWPVLNLEDSIRTKKRLDIKAPSLASDSSSSSDSDDGTTGHTEKPSAITLYTAGPPSRASQKESREPGRRWPALEHTTHVKRSVDIKAPPDSDSSSSSEEITHHVKTDEKRETNMSRQPTQVSLSLDPRTQWPVLDLEDSTRINRRLDIKAPSLASNSSSSSDSDDETTGHSEKQGPAKLDNAGPLFHVSQTENHDLGKSWPVLDLENSTRIKRSLDIKAPPHSDSSSSSDSEHGTTSHIKKQEQIETNMSRHPTKVSPTASHDPQTQWPVLNLEDSTRVKRRLDIKAPLPDSDSSSSTDSEDETTGHSEKQRLVKLDNAGLQFQESQTENHDLGKSWPVLDLENTTRIKRRLDIKAPPDSNSSSSSESEDEKNHIEKHKPGKVDIVILQTEALQIRNQGKDKRQSGLDLEHRTQVKRRLDIKAPLPDSDSSSSTDSEDETTGHSEKQRLVKLDNAGLQFQESQTENHDLGKSWPVLDLENTTRIKRRLDIKAPPDSNSSSSSESEDETNHIEKHRPDKVDIVILQTEALQIRNQGKDKRRSGLDLEHRTQVKRRLDIKAPLPDSDSSSSTDSEDETTGHSEKQRLVKLDNAGLQFQESQTENHDLGKGWPVLDLENTTRIKRRLDIKAPPDSDLSSSSESEDETNHIDKHRPDKVDIEILQTEALQIRNQGKDKRRSGLNLEHRTQVKRRLDIKATSPDSDSSSSSDSEDGRTHNMKKAEQIETYMPRFPAGVSQTVSHDPQTQWPALNLEDSTRVKRRLDIIVKSINSVSCSSSNSEDETGNIEKQSSRWPVPDLERTTHIKMRLDIKPPDSGTSSSGDSESETTHHSKRERSELMESVPFQESQTVGSDPETMWPVVDLGNITRIRRRMDIKVASPHPDSVLNAGSMNYPAKGERKEAIKISHHYSSSSSDEEEESMENLRNTPTTMEPIRDSRWPKLSLNNAPNVKRRLDIRARSPSSDSSCSESEGGITDQPVKVERDRPNMASAGHQPGTKLPDLSMSIPLIKTGLNIKAPVQPVDSCSSSSDNEGRFSRHEINKGDLELINHEQQKKLDKRSLGDLYPKRRLNIKGPSPQPDPILSSVTPGLQRSESSSSNSDSEDELKAHAKLGLGLFSMSKTKEKEFIKSPKTPVIHNHHSPKTDTSIKSEKYTTITDDMRAKTTSDTIHTTPQINPVLESQWATMSLGISRFRKRHEITSPSHESPNLPSSPPPASLSSSSSDKGGRTRRKRGEVGMQGVILTKSSMMAENPVEFASPKTENLSPGFGIPPFRRYPDLKITKRSPVTPPLQQQHRGSSSSSDSEDASVEYAGKRWEGRSQLSVVTNKEASQIQTSLYTRQAVSINLDQSHSKTSKVGDKFDSVHLKALSQRESSPSSSSSSENETNDQSVFDQSLGLHMKIKASSPGTDNPSSSSREDDNKVTANQTVHESDMSGMTDNGSLLTYKRVIFKASPPLSNTVAYSSPTRDHSIQRHSVVTTTEQGPVHSVDGKGASLPPTRVSTMSFDEVVRKRTVQSRQAPHVDASSEISWTGTSHPLSDLSISSVRRHWNMGSSTPTAEPLDSSNYSRNASDDKMKQDSGKADGTLIHKYTSVSATSVSLASSRTLDSSLGRANEISTDLSEDRRTRKGLSAIKAMSSERQKWDTRAEYLEKSASPLIDDRGPQADIRFDYPRSEAIEPLPKQPQTQSRLSSASADESRSPNGLYDIPRYRSHHIGRPQDAPPQIPATSPPDESVGPTWGSQQSSQKQVLEWPTSYLQQSSNTLESDPSSDVSQNLAVYFDSSNNISHV